MAGLLRWVLAHRLSSLRLIDTSDQLTPTPYEDRIYDSVTLL